MEIVIMAGGKGTRIASVEASVPKPMIRVLGKPVLQYQIECLQRQNLTDITLVIGHLGHVIKTYFGDGRDFGVNIRYVEETQPLGTAGALFLLKDRIHDDFLLLNGDVMLDVDIPRFLARHRACGATATLLTHPNDHPYDSSILVADGDGRVTRWMNKEDERLWYHNCVNAGLHMFSPKIFQRFPVERKVDMDRDILKPMIADGELFVYQSPEYVKDMGTPKRLYEVEADVRSGKVQAKNLDRRQKAVFLDRDGTINRYRGFLRSMEEFSLKDGAAEMIRAINHSGMLAIVVTNQPVIARGEVTWEELDAIHRKMETLLGREGAYLDDIFICPHHPDRGFANERLQYKIDCDCRKPKPGLFLKAAEQYNIDLSQSHMVGDSETDMEAGRRAGCTVHLIDRYGKCPGESEWVWLQ